MKTCIECKETKDESEFFKHKNCKGGVRANCKICEVKRTRKYLDGNKDKVTIRRQKLAAEKRALGQCRRCNEPLFNESKCYCEKHWYEGAVQNIKRFNKNNARGRNALATELKQLAIKQDFKCAYSKLPLIPSINMSLDHIIPLSLGGSNEISNFQWVDLSVNYMKLDLTEKEFLKIIHEIAKYNPLL